MPSAKHSKAVVSALVSHADEVSHPSHYGSGEIECKDAMRAMVNGSPMMPFMCFYWWLCAFKYLWRWSRKNGLIDLRKCKQCIDFLIDEMEVVNSGDQQ